MDLFTGDKQFVKHEDPEISSLSADLLADSHELSRIWKEKQTYVETEEMKLKEIVGDAVLKFKSDKIMIKRKEIMQLLEEAVKANDTEKDSPAAEKICKPECCSWSYIKEAGEQDIALVSRLES